MIYNNKLLSEKAYLVLLCLLQADTHGYEIHKEVKKMLSLRESDFPLRLSSIYAILSSLEKAKLIEPLDTKDELGIVLYHITDLGIALFKEETKFRRRFVELGENILANMSAIDGHTKR